MVSQSRFQFPGFALTATKDTSTHEVEIGAIKDGETVFVLEMIRNKQFSFLSFAVASISNPKDEQLWNFKQAAFDGIGLLAMAGTQLVIALVGRGKYGKVERVIPFSSFSSHTPISIRDQIQLKKSAAEFLNRNCELSSFEERLYAADQIRIRAELEAAKAAAAIEREKNREERIRTMVARGRVTGYTSDGQKRHGIPVLDSEWTSCSNGVYVVIVDSIGDDGKIGKLVEAFRVVKERGKNPEKGFPASVTTEMPKVFAPSQMIPLPLRSTIIEKDKDAFEVRLFASMDQIRAARQNGLNSGSYVAVDEVDGDGKIIVYSVHSDKVVTVGKFIPLA